MFNSQNLAKLGNFFAIHKNHPSDKVYFHHLHDSHEINFFIKIKLKVFLKDTKYFISDGDVLFINAYDLHHCLYDNTTTIHNRYIINFTKDYIYDNLKAAGIENILDSLKNCSYTHSKTTLKEKLNLEYLFKSLIAVNSLDSNELSSNYKEAQLKSYLILIIIKIHELIMKNSNKKKISKKGILVKNIIKYIDDNFKKDITLNLLEETFYVNKFHISHVFKEITDFSVIEYVQQKRIIEAQKQLTLSNKKIIDICFDCGFNSIQHFHRVFKKISGATPYKYRKNYNLWESKKNN